MMGSSRAPMGRLCQQTNDEYHTLICADQIADDWSMLASTEVKLQDVGIANIIRAEKMLAADRSS